MRKTDFKPFLTNLLLLAGFFLAWQLFLQPRQPSQAPPPGQVTEQARKLEEQARDAKLPRADRLQRYEDAIRKYQEIHHHDGSSQAGIDARYQELRVLSEQSALNKDDTGYYDRAESLLK